MMHMPFLHKQPGEVGRGDQSCWQSWMLLLRKDEGEGGKVRACWLVAQEFRLDDAVR